MRYVIVALMLALLGACATVPTTGTPRAFHDRKYNTYHPLRSDAAEPRPLQTAPRYDRKYNTVLPSRRHNAEVI